MSHNKQCSWRLRSAPTTKTMPAADKVATVQSAPAEVNAGVAEAANNAPVFFHANDPLTGSTTVLGAQGRKKEWNEAARQVKDPMRKASD